MHNLLTTSTDLLKCTAGSAADLDCIVSFSEYTNNASPPVLDPPDTQFTNINTAATATILGAPTTANDRRKIQAVSIVNTHATVSTTVRVFIERTGPVNWDVWNTVTLAPGESLTFTPGTGWYHNKATGKLDVYRYVTADYINATTSFSDITGLTVPVESGKHYAFMAHLYHIENASTTGARFAINGPAMTLMQLQELGGFAGGVGAGTMQANVGSVAALDTAAIAATSSAGTPQVIMAILSGYINPSAAGTFAVRGASEVAVAAGLTVKKGSWLHLFEVPQG